MELIANFTVHPVRRPLAICHHKMVVVKSRVRIVKNKLHGRVSNTAETKGLGVEGSQWNEQWNWGLNPPTSPSIQTLVKSIVKTPCLDFISTADFHSPGRVDRKEMCISTVNLTGWLVYFLVDWLVGFMVDWLVD